jgi:hypothetical protein
MNETRYLNINTSPNHQIFTFISEGRHGELEKIVRFDKLTNTDNSYNIALGTMLNNGHIDYTGTTNNGDRNKAFGNRSPLNIYFLEKNPGCAVY